ncbi:MAG: nicotinate (nicotinamide) nucleotide adenylyltransferase [Bacteroidales bacterium]|jgi:nicotinate-nucleotide adenylyltransferase|nr:nicotinate (nicotinamide) nucleotide adenylyltransferase [Bacteroidales bacterium]
MYKEKEAIGLLFGSFNPLHNAHIAIADYFIKNNYVDEVWFVISPQSPFKQHFTTNDSSNRNQEYFISEDKRLELLNKSLEKHSEFKVCDIEFSMPRPSYTIDTLKRLSEEYPDKEFILIIGSDLLKDFKLWKDWQEILNNYQVYVYPRDYNDSKYILSEMKFFGSAPLIDISSSQIREKIDEGENVDKMIPDEIRKMI